MWQRLFRRGASVRPPVPAVLYTRAGCHLCEALKAELASSRFPPFDLTEIDIEGDPELEAAHGRSIPVLAIGGEIVAKGKVEPRALRRRFERLAAAWHAGRDREGQGNG
jgi:hypothetical protein